LFYKPEAAEPPAGQPEGHSSQQNAEPVDPASSGPALVVGGHLTFRKQRFTGEVNEFGALEIKIDLNLLTESETEALLNSNESFEIHMDLDLGSEKNVHIGGVLVEDKETLPSRVSSKGEAIPEREIVSRIQYVDGTSRARTLSSEKSNVFVIDYGRVTFMKPINGRTTGTFRGAFRMNPDTTKSSSFSISVFTKRPDYIAKEKSTLQVRLILTARK
jgi:hypothetical protein